MVLASTGSSRYNELPKMAAASVSTPRENPSLLLPLWETLQDEQVGLTQAPFKLLLLCWDSEYMRFCTCPLRVESRGFPGGAVVESPPASAGDTGSRPGLGGSHVPRSNWAREPQLLSLRIWSLCSATREAAMVRGPRTVMKSGPRLPQLEKALAQKQRPNTAKNK